MKINVLCLITAILSFNVFADCSGSDCKNVKVSRMYVTADGSSIIGTSGDESKLTCDAGPSGYLKLDPNDKNYNATYSLILTAHTTTHPIWIRVSGGTEACKIMYVVSDK